MIVHHKEPITLVGGAEITKARITRALSLARHVVAADGGADAALAHGVVPQAVIGDFNSLSEAGKAALPKDVLFPIDDQNSTDFDKCMTHIAAPLIIGIGFSGARLDHQLASYNTLVRYPHRRCVLLGSEELVFLAPPSISLPVPAGCPLSLFPMGAVEGVSEGLRWPIAGLNLAPDGQISTSNEATGPVQLSVTSPKMLVILPEAMLEVVAAALLDQPSYWPGGG